MSSDTVLQLFAKLPIAGEVKTRLIPQLGEQPATAIYRYCLRYSLALMQQTQFQQQLWLNRKGIDELFSDYTPYLQQGQDLGEKMFYALSEGLKHHQKCILIGSDCLDLDLQILEQVEQQLSSHDLVLVPALDGGYVLIGARESIHPAVFQGISWSTERVLQQTLRKCMQHNIKTFILPVLRDIDLVEDLQHYPELQSYLK